MKTKTINRTELIKRLDDAAEQNAALIVVVDQIVALIDKCKDQKKINRTFGDMIAENVENIEHVEWDNRTQTGRIIILITLNEPEDAAMRIAISRYGASHGNWDELRGAFTATDRHVLLKQYEQEKDLIPQLADMEEALRRNLAAARDGIEAIEGTVGGEFTHLIRDNFPMLFEDYIDMDEIEGTGMSEVGG